MQPANTIDLGSSYAQDANVRTNIALAAWSVTVSMLLGAVVIAGFAMTAIRLQVSR